MTYGQAADLVARAGGALRERIDPGDRVLVATPNGYRLFLSCLAVGRAGGVAVPVNPRMADDEIAYIEEDANVTARLDDFDELVAAPAAPAVAVDPAEVAVLFYTSGTTGRRRARS